MSLIPWEQLERLSIRWRTVLTKSPAQDSLSSISSRLANLQALRLHGDYWLTFHEQCLYGQDGNSETASFAIDFLKLDRLEQLELLVVCNHMSMDGRVGPNLRYLDIHTRHVRYPVFIPENLRKPNDIVVAAKMAPNSDKLELDTGFIDNLWDTTPIPNVTWLWKCVHFLMPSAIFAVCTPQQCSLLP